MDPNNPAGRADTITPVTSDLPPLLPGWGPRIDGSKVRFWGTKKDAIAGAKAIGWTAKRVTPVHTRFQGVWAIAHDGGWLSRETYGELWHDRNRAGTDPT